MNQELGDVQLQFAELVWDEEPIGSGDLVKRCEQEFSWKKSTTYTVLKKLCEKGILTNQNGIVTSLVSRAQYYATRSEQFVADTFQGSLPAFLAAFSSSKKLSKEDVVELQKMIDTYKEEHHDETIS